VAVSESRECPCIEFPSVHTEDDHGGSIRPDPKGSDDPKASEGDLCFCDKCQAWHDKGVNRVRSDHPVSGSDPSSAPSEGEAVEGLEVVGWCCDKCNKPIPIPIHKNCTICFESPAVPLVRKADADKRVTQLKMLVRYHEGKLADAEARVKDRTDESDALANELQRADSRYRTLVEGVRRVVDMIPWEHIKKTDYPALAEACDALRTLIDSEGGKLEVGDE